ncbi:sugar/nucleoside kinase (ribokinase family) [Streptacidiphilus sp. MAP5-52]
MGLLGPARFLELVGGGVDMLLPNLDEARLLSGATDPERAAVLLAERTGSLIAVKLGPRGALLAGPEGLLGRVPAPALERPAVDTTGAGDAFAGALLAARLAGTDPLRAAAHACAAGARAVQRQGARPSG